MAKPLARNVAIHSPWAGRNCVPPSGVASRRPRGGELRRGEVASQLLKEADAWSNLSSTIPQCRCLRSLGM